VGSRVKVASAGLQVESPDRPIRRLLVANRGELVVRIARTCRRLGITCLALVADDQARAWWTGFADELVPLPGSYLDAAAVLEAARLAGADAIHPGYGFLAESADFADAVAATGLAWVGPPGDAMRALGDKRGARRVAAANGVPIVPGYDGDAQSDTSLRAAAAVIGYPLLVKAERRRRRQGHARRCIAIGTHEPRWPQLGAKRQLPLATTGWFSSATWGGHGMSKCSCWPTATATLCTWVSASARSNAGTRRSSRRRPHRPSTPGSGGRLGDAAIRLAGAAGYIGAGTAEFLLDDTGNFYFLELNARLQVEHPVTEAITGRDLVADQLRVASGERLGFDQSSVTFDGHAVEARLYAEDPWHDFLPSGRGSTGCALAATRGRAYRCRRRHGRCDRHALRPLAGQSHWPRGGSRDRHGQARCRARRCGRSRPDHEPWIPALAPRSTRRRRPPRWIPS
jgi:geranyl-CoA carboxylase alpha subunit